MAKIYYDEWCKDLRVVDYKDEEGKEYCVFHAPVGKKGISAEEFNRLIFDRIKLAKETDQSCNLLGTIFEWDIHFDQFNQDNPLPPVDFEEATFNGKAWFSESKFNGKAVFREATFNGEADFVLTTFKEGVGFSSTTFNRGACFSRATFFSGVAGFWDATFNGEADFKRATFRGADFSHTTFNGKADFFVATFNEETRFWKATFNGEAVFVEATFNEEAVFRWAIFNVEAVFRQAIFNRGVNFEGLRIKEKILFEGSDLKKVIFLNTDLRKIDFINCIWPKRLGRNLLYDEISIFGDDRQTNSRFKGGPSQILRQEWDGFKKDIAPDKEMIKKVEILYRMLKQKYKEEHNEYEVSNWHYGEKEMFRKGSYFRRFFPLSLSSLYWLSSGYGERPVRAGIVLISLISILSILTALSGFKPPEGGFAAIILNTLQYATLQKATLLEPASLAGAYLKLLTQILIPLQTALFALAIKNRFKR